jgi:hypothetical protein
MKRRAQASAPDRYKLFPNLGDGHNQLEFQEAVQKQVRELLDGGKYLQNGTDSNVFF